MFSWLKNETSQSRNEENLKQKIKEVKEDYQDYPTKRSALSDEKAKELAQIRMEIEAKYGKYKNKDDIEALKKNALICRKYAFREEYPESIYRHGGCGSITDLDPADPASSNYMECVRAESEIKYIFKGKKCKYIAEQNGSIPFFKCQQISEDFRKLRDKGLNSEEAFEVINHRNKKGLY